ncbi:MAG: phosphomannomutase/phosphoglucomutase [Acidimicrobiia bacterium]|nr:phosphomannomutase/phosphoglucomutase [Acidimicrobiia bacterium]
MDLSAIFKAYDVRGTVPDQLDDDATRRIGAAFARFADTARIAVGRDCRESSPDLAAALIDGITSQGVAVDDLGMITTDMVYYAAGAMDQPGVMITASHNPKGYNGIKLCLAGAAPVGADTGLKEVRVMAERELEAASEPGEVVEVDPLPGYIEHLMSIVNPDKISRLRVAADGGNGVAGVALPGVFAQIPAQLTGLYLEPDGTFPNHHPDPLRPENLADIEALLRSDPHDLGVAFDGDADRAFFIDDQLNPLPGSTVTGIIADWFLQSHPGSKIVHNLICSKAVPETVRAAGGEPVRTRVGHSYIKQVMNETGAIFGGEHSGHYYFRDNYRADSGILAMLVLLQVLSEDGRPLSDLRSDYEPYAQSGEINFDVVDKDAAISAIAEALSDGDADRLDGLTVDFGDRWLNVRPSNTEPVLRLNVEAPTPEEVSDLVSQVRAILAGSDGGAGLLPPGLLEIMQCPSCGGVLAEVAEPPSLLCSGCGLQYPVEDGIPVMLIEEATQT